MTAAPGRPGQPLFALGLLLASWLVARVAGFGDPSRPAGHPAQEQGGRDRPPQSIPASPRPVPTGPVVLLASLRLGTAPLTRGTRGHHGGRTDPQPRPTAWSDRAGPPAQAAVTPLVPAFQAPPGPLPEAARARNIWSADAWLLARGGAAGPPGSTFYGASQLGAIVRFRLAPDSPYRPSVYLRAATALAVTAQQDAAAGIGLRPWPSLPVVTAVEARLTRDRFASRLRPAAMAVTELPPLPLPLGVTSEIYAQGGWIGGPAAGLFGDLQLRAERPFRPRGGWQPRLGAGLWAAGQRGAQRLDLGPVVSLAGQPGTGPALRLEIDWRLRAAGNAAPGSGPAVVLAASF